MVLRIRFVSMLAQLTCLALLGATYTVPDDAPFIQTAIDSAGSGDTVPVRAGTPRRDTS